MRQDLIAQICSREILWTGGRTGRLPYRSNTPATAVQADEPMLIERMSNGERAVVEVGILQSRDSANRVERERHLGPGTEGVRDRELHIATGHAG